MHLGTIIALALTLAAGQDLTEVRRMFDAGRYRDVVGAAEEATAEADKASRLQYLAAQSYAKLDDADAARRTYQRLADGNNAWAPLGRSAVQLMDKQLDEALESANQAVHLGSSLPEAHYQRGLVLMTRKDYGAAAAAFTKATELDSTFATAYYYAGLAYYRERRVDLMTRNFETFVRLAPDSPERPEVQSILRTVRGR